MSSSFAGSLSFSFRERQKKKKRGKKINLSVFAARLAGGEVWVLFFKPQRPPNFHFSLFPPLLHPPCSHLHSSATLSPKRPNKEEKKQNKTESKVSAQGTRRGFKEREREQGDRTNNGSRFLLQGEKKKITSRNPDFFDLVSFLVINLCL